MFGTRKGLRALLYWEFTRCCTLGAFQAIYNISKGNELEALRVL